MYSEELINYLYKYDMPSKKTKKANSTIPAGLKTPLINLLKFVKKAYAIVPVKFKDE